MSHTSPASTEQNKKQDVYHATCLDCVLSYNADGDDDNDDDDGDGDNDDNDGW